VISVLPRQAKACMTDPGWKPVETLKETGALQDHVRDYAIFLLDREGNVRSWNNSAKAIKQYEAHGVAIDVISTPGSGITFIVTLPREAPSAEQDNPRAQEAGRLGS
jgi:hypothetical protein